MFQNTIKTRRITYLAMLVGLSFVFKSIISLELAEFRFSFYDLPLFVTGMLFGPLYGMMAGLIADLLHIAMPNNLAVAPNLMTVASMSWGFLGGLFFYGKKRLSPILLGTAVITASLFSFTVISIQLYGPQAYGFFGFTPIPGIFTRFGALLIKVPIQIMFLRIIFDRVIAGNEIHLATLERKNSHS